MQSTEGNKTAVRDACAVANKTASDDSTSRDRVWFLLTADDEGLAGGGEAHEPPAHAGLLRQPRHHQRQHRHRRPAPRHEQTPQSASGYTTCSFCRGAKTWREQCHCQHGRPALQTYDHVLTHMLSG